MNDLEYEQCLRVAWYYYIEEYTQTEIAEKLNITRNTVVKILKEAKQNGVINFNIERKNNYRIDLEQELSKKYDLKDVFLVPEVDDKSNLNESISKSAAMYLLNWLHGADYINIGYGDTLNRLLNHYAKLSENTTNIVSLTGGVNYYLPNAKSNLFNAKVHLIPAPFILKDKNLRDALLEDASVLSVTNMINFSDISVIGIGGINENATLIKNGSISQSEMEILKMRGAVGDILCHFIDKDGNLIENSLEDRLISTSLEKLKNMQNVIAVAGGEHKVPAIKAALKGKYIDILITDESTAKKL